MKQTRWLSEFSCLSEYTRLYPNCLLLLLLYVFVLSLFCGAVLSVLLSFTIISLRKRELATLLKMYPGYRVGVYDLFLFLIVSWVRL